MMRVFEKLHALGASASVDAIETEQTVSWEKNRRFCEFKHFTVSKSFLCS
jgi:hypothetical protein